MPGKSHIYRGGPWRQERCPICRLMLRDPRKPHECPGPPPEPPSLFEQLMGETETKEKSR